MITNYFCRFSMRTRFLTGMGCMLIPFLLLWGSVTYFLKDHSKAFEDVVEEALHEKDPVMNIQFQVYEAIILIHRHVIFGNSQETKNFTKLVHEIEQRFNEISNNHFRLETERDILDRVHLEWQNCRYLSDQILSMKKPVASADAIETVQALEKHFSQLLDHLRSFHHLANQEIHDEIEIARNTQQRTLFVNMGLFITAVLGALAVGIFMSRSILLPIKELYQGVKEFAKGNMKFRLTTVCKDEIGNLIKDFNSMADAIQQSQTDLKKAATMDPLTGILNRPTFFDLMHMEIERSRRYNHSVSLLMIDLDFFKEVNDTYGHPIGDSVLKMITAIINNQLRQTDIIGRYGGDEFFVLLPETNINQAYNFAKRIHKAVTTSPISLEKEVSLHVTISVGLSTFPLSAASSEALFSVADQSLYSAKRKGRNQVFCPHQV